VDCGTKRALSPQGARLMGVKTVGAALVVLGIGTFVSVARAQAPALSYGPIIGRGQTPDKMIIKWGTNAAVATPTISYRVTGAAAYQTATGTGKCPSANQCDNEVWLSGLSLGTQYDYATGSGAALGPPYTFGTCPAAGGPMDLVFYGDSRT